MKLSTTIISIFSLAVALTALYLTQLRPPDLVTNVGPSIKAYHLSNGGLAFIVPITFANLSPIESSIERAAVTLYRKDVPQERYFVAWHRFMSYFPETNNWQEGGIAHALPITGNSYVTRVALFPWESHTRPQLHLEAGEYTLVFHYWETGDDRPKSEKHRFTLSKEMAKKLAKYREEQKRNAIDITLDKKIERNKFMTEHEYKALLE